MWNKSEVQLSFPFVQEETKLKYKGYFLQNTSLTESGSYLVLLVPFWLHLGLLNIELK